MAEKFGWEVHTETKPEPTPPMGLIEWAEETQRMLNEVYPRDIFIRDPKSAEPGCQILYEIEVAMNRFYEIRNSAGAQ